MYDVQVGRVEASDEVAKSYHIQMTLLRLSLGTWCTSAEAYSSKPHSM